MPVKKNAYLQDVLETHRMTHIEGLLSKYKSKRDEVKEALEENYHSKIYSPINSGSYAKHTAINSKFDLDIVVPFKRDSFESLKKMFCDVCCFLEEKYGSAATVRKQKVSIGMQFHADIIDLDIVPGREFNKSQYEDDKNINLFVDSNYGIIEEKTWIQTNIKAQINHIRQTGDSIDSVRQIIRLLKIWKNSDLTNKPYKSFLLELLTIKAFDDLNVTGNLWKKLKIVMEYIRDNITKDGFNLIDPGNSNNNVMDTLGSLERVNLSNRMEIMLSRINDNDGNIKTYFPINETFKDELSSNTSYRIKGATVASSIPKNNQRFG